MKILKKFLYNKLILKKNLNTLNTYNLKKQYINLELKKIYTFYILTQDINNTKMYIKEISGILIKISKKYNLTNLHLVCLKKYNNIYFSFFKESPNICFNKI